jgi:hypothetical protein
MDKADGRHEVGQRRVVGLQHVIREEHPVFKGHGKGIADLKRLQGLQTSGRGQRPSGSIILPAAGNVA